jgi:hypothetical protein
VDLKTSNKFAVAILGAVLGSACVASQRPRHNTPGEPVAVFPARGELSNEPKAGPTRRAGLLVTDVPRWELAPEVNTTANAAESSSVWDRFLAEQLTSRLGQSAPAGSVAVSARPSPALACAATEVARFFVEHGAYPAEGLRKFIAMRCGSSLPRLAIAAVNTQASPKLSDRQLLNDTAPELERLLSEIPLQGEMELGVGAAHGGDRAAVVVLSGRVEARLFDVSPLVEGNGKRLSGQVPKDAVSVLGVVNRGKLGVAVCEPDRTLTLPNFALFCPVSGDDAAARIQIAVRRPKRVLLDSVAELLVRRGAADGLVFEPGVYGPDVVSASPKGFRDALYVSLAAARTSAGAAPLAPSPRQAELNQRLAPALFQAFAVEDMQLADRLALELLAGWEVEGMIREGAVAASTGNREPRAARWLGTELENPLTRYLLLDPRMTLAAAGVVDSNAGGMAAVITTYALFRPEEHAREAQELLNELTQSRAARGKRRPKLRSASDALRKAVARIGTQGISAFAALQDAINDIQQDESETLSGWAVESQNLREIRWPVELLGPQVLDVEVGLTYYRPRGAAWGQYAAIFVIHPAPGKSAERTELPRL